MNREPKIFENAQAIKVGIIKVSYESEISRERALLLDLGEGKDRAEVIVSHIKGEKHLNRHFIRQRAKLKVEVEPVEHRGEKKLWKARRILVIGESGEAVIVFT